LLDIKHGWTIKAIWDVNNKKWRKWCKIVSPIFFNNTYGLLVFSMNTKCPNQLFYYWMVLNRGWKRDSPQIIICVYLCSTWSIVELKTRFETRITRYDVNGLRMFHISYLITLLAFLCSQRTPNVQMKYLCLIGRSTDYLC
jgi:hypothetical protein